MLIVSNLNNNDLLVVRERNAGELVFIENDDNAVVRRFQKEVEQYDVSLNKGKRLECYLLFKDLTSLWLLQTAGIPESIREKADVFASTIEDLLAKMIFVKLPNISTIYPSLDRIPVSCDSETTVHLVLMGFTSQAEALAINATLVAHYPNYCKNTKFRTRITIIADNVFEGRDRLVQRYVHLFDNSYYRTIDLNERNPCCVVHRPMYESKRKDFVDVEWEFVNGNSRNEAVRLKLSEWSCSLRQQLTIAICHSDDDQNFAEALALPEAVYKNEIPILCRTEESDMLRFINSKNTYASIYPFGKSCGNIDTLRVLKNLALRVNYVYNHCFSLAPNDPITAPANIDETLLETQWQKVSSLSKQYSNYFNAMTLGTKMHSLGHTSEDWKAYYALSMDEIEILAEVEHNRWNVEELVLGYRPVTDEEQKIVENDIGQKRILRNNKIHYDLRAFDDLRSDSTGKRADVYDRVLSQGIPLIIKTCITN